MAGETTRSAPPRDQTPLTAAAAHKNLAQLIQLRWIAVAGQIITIAVVQFGLHIRLPLMAMGGVLAGFLAANVVSAIRLRIPLPVTNPELFFSLTLDALVLTGLLYLSGGARNPFASLYLLQVILGAVLLDAWAVWAMIGVAILCFGSLAFYHRPLVLPAGGLPPYDLYTAGTVICFALNAVLLVVFISRINANLRLRDARLADMRQQAAEEDHIVRMGLLASGAAHELGTPLATLDVILADWRRMPDLTGNPELAQDIELMRSELARSKAIVSGVLVSAGEVRGEHASAAPLRVYVADVFEEWRVTRSPANAAHHDALDVNPLIVADSALKQALHNLLDNALDASPGRVTMRTRRVEDELEFAVSDAGPGFTAEMLAHLGTPYNSTKGRLGGGLGLFLVVNVVRKLGGQVEARNRDGGGADVTVRLPLASLTIERSA